MLLCDLVAVALGLGSGGAAALPAPSKAQPSLEGDFPAKRDMDFLLGGFLASHGTRLHICILMFFSVISAQPTQSAPLLGSEWPTREQAHMWSPRLRTPEFQGCLDHVCRKVQPQLT